MTEEERLADEEKAAREAEAAAKAKPAKKDPPAKDAPPSKEPGELVTYRPGEGDPVSIKWREVEFRANVPVRILDPDHIDSARGNRTFSVGDAKRDDSGDPPVDAMSYRGHVVNWLKRVDTVDHFVACWSADRDLRAKCEIGQDDLNYLGTLIEPKLLQMRKAEGLSPNDVAGVFVRRGILEIPWRS